MKSILTLFVVLVAAHAYAQKPSEQLDKLHAAYADKLEAMQGDVIEAIAAREEAARDAGDMNGTRSAQLDMKRFQVGSVIPAYVRSKKLDEAYAAYEKVNEQFDREIKTHLKAHRDSSANGIADAHKAFRTTPINVQVTVAYWTHKLETTRVRSNGLEYKGTWSFHDGVAVASEQMWKGAAVADTRGKYEIDDGKVRITWSTGAVDFLPLPLTQKFEIVNNHGGANPGFVLR